MISFNSIESISDYGGICFDCCTGIVNYSGVQSGYLTLQHSESISTYYTLNSLIILS